VDELERLVVSASVMKVILQEVNSESSQKAMIDSGASVPLVPLQLAKLHVLVIIPHTDGRSIGTADQDGILPILYWVDLGGYIGLAAVSDKVSFIIVSVSQLQKRGLGVNFPIDECVCELYHQHGVLDIVQQCTQTLLYYVDIMSLMGPAGGHAVPYVATDLDVAMNSSALLGGWAGISLFSKGAGVHSIDPPRSSTKKKPTHDMTFRVWGFHRRMQHVSLCRLSQMIKDGLIIDTGVQAWEIDLVNAQQDCYACALAKWKRLSVKPCSGLHPLVIGSVWSMDYSGPDATKAIGGFTGRFTFLELSVDYGVVFLVKSKMEAFASVVKINLLCRKYGYQFVKLRVDQGSVENSELFLQQCAAINSVGTRGIEVFPANVEMQNQNPVERGVQTADNMIATVMVDQDLLGACFWGWASIAVWRALNAVTNSLCPMSTPLFEFEGKFTNAAKMFKNP
jgi:hypothetical protein